jgi:tetratricopeptide (TPR) repeat protein
MFWLNRKNRIIELDGNSKDSEIGSELLVRIHNHLNNTSSDPYPGDCNQITRSYNFYFSENFKFVLIIEHERFCMEYNAYVFTERISYGASVCNLETRRNLSYGSSLFKGEKGYRCNSNYGLSYRDRCLEWISSLFTFSFKGEKEKSLSDISFSELSRYNIVWDSSLSSFVLLHRSNSKIALQIKINYDRKENQGKSDVVLLGLDVKYVKGLLKRGEANITYNHYKEAVTVFTNAIIIDPTCAKAYNGRARAKEKLNDPKGSLEDYFKAIELDPSDPVTYFYRACLKNGLNDLKGVIEDLDKAIVLSNGLEIEIGFPRLSNMYFERAKAKSIIGDEKGAVEDFFTHMDVNPFDHTLKSPFFHLVDSDPCKLNFQKAIDLRKFYTTETLTGFIYTSPYGRGQSCHSFPAVQNIMVNDSDEDLNTDNITINLSSQSGRPETQVSEELYNLAHNFFFSSAHSINEISTYLSGKGCDSETISLILKRIEDENKIQGYQDEDAQKNSPIQKIKGKDLDEGLKNESASIDLNSQSGKPEIQVDEELYNLAHKLYFLYANTRNEISMHLSSKGCNSETINLILKRIEDEKKEQENHDNEAQKNTPNDKYLFWLAAAIAILFFIIVIISGPVTSRENRNATNFLLGFVFIIVYIIIKAFR